MKHSKNNNKLEAKLKRKEMMEQGVYDGRYIPKVFKDKKKESRKNGRHILNFWE